jgi:ABC-type dipeptide/oligopeptide/nickel transport system permease subunit
MSLTITIIGLTIGIIVGACSGVHQQFFEMYLFGWAGSYTLITLGGYL